MPAVMNVMKEDATFVTLVKPQFEARRSQVINLLILRCQISDTLNSEKSILICIIYMNHLCDFYFLFFNILFPVKVGKGGIVRDPEVHQEVCLYSCPLCDN